MGSLSIWHWLIVLAVVMVLFGGSGKVSSLMGDVAKGLKTFKKTMAEDHDVSMEAGAEHRPANTIAAPGVVPGTTHPGMAPGAHAADPVADPARRA